MLEEKQKQLNDMGKEYNMNLTKRYKVEFVKNGTRYKKGDAVEVNMPTAAGFFKDGKIKPTQELIADARELGCADLFGVKAGKEG